MPLTTAEQHIDENDTKKTDSCQELDENLGKQRIFSGRSGSTCQLPSLAPMNLIPRLWQASNHSLLIPSSPHPHRSYRFTGQLHVHHPTPSNEIRSCTHIAKCSSNSSCAKFFSVLATAFSSRIVARLRFLPGIRDGAGDVDMR